MGRQIIRVEPLSTYLERWKAPTSAVTRSGDTLYVSGFPPFDPDTGDVVQGASIERQTELVLEQMKLCLRTARRIVPGQRAQMHRVLHLGRQVRRGQRRLRPLLSDRAAGAGLRVRPGLAGGVRHRSGLRRHGVRVLHATGGRPLSSLVRWSDRTKPVRRTKKGALSESHGRLRRSPLPADGHHVR
jgi:hypothetical protein